MNVGVRSRGPQEEAELNDCTCSGDTARLDREADEAVNRAVTALERMRVFLGRRELYKRGSVSALWAMSQR